MSITTSCYRCLAICLLALLGLAVMAITPSFARPSTDGPRTNGIGTAIDYNTYQAGAELTAHSVLSGLSTARGRHDVRVTAHGICRYIDVSTNAPGDGVLVPFASANEWKGSGDKGFIATAGHRNNYLKLDFCRETKVFGTIDFGDIGGISIFQPTNDATVQSGNGRTVLTPDRMQSVTDAASVRIDTRSDGAFDASLQERRAHNFNLSRPDCLGPTSYPDGTVRNPCFTWNWVEEITATFVDEIRANNDVLNRGQVASAVTATPVINPNESWRHTLARTSCLGGSPPVSANDNRPLPGFSCPPPVTPPTLRACPPGISHNEHHWVTTGPNQVQYLGCGPGFLESTNPQHNHVWDDQTQYWCFDGTDYPETNITRRINEHDEGSCALIVNGSCGSSPGACTSGQPNGLSGSDLAGWTWTCQGSNGSNAPCNIPGVPACSPYRQQSCAASGVVANGGTDNDTRVTIYNEAICGGNSGGDRVTAHTCCSSTMPNPNWFGAVLPACGGAPSYDWVASGFGACSATCGGGTQTQTVSCRRSDGQPAVDSLCNPATRPATSQACNMQACPPVCVEGTEPESIPCGAGFTGMQTRTRTINIGGVCNANSDWSPYDRSACVVVCTAAGQHLYNGTCINDCSAYEEHDLCDTASGNFTGTHVQRRTRDTVSCPAFSGPWTDYGANTCTPVATGPVCEPVMWDVEDFVHYRADGHTEIPMCDRFNLRDILCAGFGPECTVQGVVRDPGSSGSRCVVHGEACHNPPQGGYIPTVLPGYSGVCGTANGMRLTAAPPPGWACSVGTMTDVQQPGPNHFTWTCEGGRGGSSDPTCASNPCPSSGCN